MANPPLPGFHLTLTAVESTVLLDSRPLHLVQNSRPSDLRQLFRDARTAAETPHDRIVIQNARKASSRAREENVGARELLNEDDRKNIIWCNRTNWASKLEQDKPGQQWGFALYRTDLEDDKSWQHFKPETERLTNVALALVKDSVGIQRLWIIHYIEERNLGGASIAQLAGNFRRRISLSDGDGTTISSYLRHDAFLFAFGEAIESAFPPHPKVAVSDRSLRKWVYAVDALHTESRLETYKHGFQGSVKVCLPNVLTTFFARLAPRSSIEDQPEENNKMMQSFDVICFKSRYNPGGLFNLEMAYPPMSLCNRGSGRSSVAS